MSDLNVKKVGLSPVGSKQTIEPASTSQEPVPAKENKIQVYFLGESMEYILSDGTKVVIPVGTTVLRIPISYLQKDLNQEKMGSLGAIDVILVSQTSTQKTNTIDTKTEEENIPVQSTLDVDTYDYTFQVKMFPDKFIVVITDTSFYGHLNYNPEIDDYELANKGSYSRSDRVLTSVLTVPIKDLQIKEQFSNDSPLSKDPSLAASDTIYTRLTPTLITPNYSSEAPLVIMEVPYKSGKSEDLKKIPNEIQDKVIDPYNVVNSKKFDVSIPLAVGSMMGLYLKSRGENSTLTKEIEEGLRSVFYKSDEDKTITFYLEASSTIGRESNLNVNTVGENFSGEKLTFTTTTRDEALNTETTERIRDTNKHTIFQGTGTPKTQKRERLKVETGGSIVLGEEPGKKTALEFKVRVSTVEPEHQLPGAKGNLAIKKEIDASKTLIFKGSTSTAKEPGNIDGTYRDSAGEFIGLETKIDDQHKVIFGVGGSQTTGSGYDYVTLKPVEGKQWRVYLPHLSITTNDGDTNSIFYFSPFYQHDRGFITDQENKSVKFKENGLGVDAGFDSIISGNIRIFGSIGIGNEEILATSQGNYVGARGGIEIPFGKLGSFGASVEENAGIYAARVGVYGNPTLLETKQTIFPKPQIQQISYLSFLYLKEDKHTICKKILETSILSPAHQNEFLALLATAETNTEIKDKLRPIIETSTVSDILRLFEKDPGYGKNVMKSLNRLFPEKAEDLLWSSATLRAELGLKPGENLAEK